jgi:hypothetical protein
MKKILLLLSFLSITFIGFSQSATTNTPATNITYESADVSGSVDALGTGTYNCFFYYRVNGTSTWTHQAATPSTVNGTGSQSESTSITGLSASTTYDYVMILEDQGSFPSVKANGSVETFTTNAAPTASTPSSSNVAQHSATITGGGNANGNGTYDAAIGYKSPSDFDYTWKAATPSTINGSSQTGFTADLTTLDANTTYTIVSALFQSGTKIAQSSSTTFTTLALAAPTISTGTAANISQNDFDVNGNDLTDDGGDPITEQGLVYSTVNNPPTTADSKQTYTPLGQGSFDVSLSSLTANTTYYVRAYAINSTGTGYGSTISQTTSAAVVPTVTIPATIDNITKIDADNTGNNATDDGGASITDKGIVWNTAGSPTLSDNAFSSGATGTGTFNGSLSGLSAGTKYYVRAYASNTAGDGYSSSVNFITNTDDPTLLAAASDVQANQFEADWSTTTGAQGYYLDVATDAGFTSMVSGYNNLDVGNVTNKVVTSLTANTTYYYRIRAYHDGGDNGADFTSGNSGTNNVTTLVDAPTVQVSDMKWETVNGGKDMAFNWTPGNGSATIFVMKDGGSVQNPNGGDTYNADANFGDGDNIDATGTYVVYNSSHAKSTSYLTVTGLTNGNTYYFKAMDYNGSGTTTNYNTSATTGYNSGNSGTTGLPVSLLSFDAEVSGQYVNLNWETASEENNDYFIVERSLDAENFAPIGKIQGAGNSNVMQKYQFTDTDVPSNTVVYYRLHQYDFDGNDEIFPSVSVSLIDVEVGIQSMSMLDNTLIINYSNPTGINTVFQVVDINGRSLQMAVSTASGQQSVNFNLTGLSHGLYFISMEQENKLITRKFVY